MARIPLGNFGNAIAQPAPGVRIPAGAFDNGGAGMKQFGDTLIGIGNDMMAEQKRVDERVASITAHGSVQTGLADLSDAVVRGIGDGSIQRDAAEATFTSEAQKLVKEQTKTLDPNTQRIVQADSISIAGRYTNIVRDAAVKRGQEDTKAGLLSYIEDMQRLAMTDRDKATSQAETAIDGLGPHAGLDPVAIHTLKQKTREGIAYNSALRMVSGTRDSLAGIESSLQALDGPAFTDLDPKQSEILRSSLLTHRLRLENKIDSGALRVEARAEKAINNIDQQIASGIPATPQMWSHWAGQIRGTSQEEAFQERIKEEELTQRLLREPLDRQISFLQVREASLLQGGGTVRDRANLDRLKRVVEAGKKQLEEAPLLFAQNRTGEAVKPIDLSLLLDPSRGQELSAVFAERTATLGALQKQYGPMVKPRVLLPLEAENLTKILNQTAPDQQVEVFRAVRLAVGDDASYQGALAQIAPDSPVKALAGSLAARGVDYVQAHTFSADETIRARQTAQFALLGESLLNPSKARKGSDGSTRTWIMPKKVDMLRRFADKVGDTFAGMPEAMDAQFEFVQSTYAGMLASRGALKNPEVVDSGLLDQAIERTTPVMKQGGASFLKPVVGMSDDQFREKLRAALPDELKPQSDRLALRNVRSNQYVILNGARPMIDKAGNPLIVTVQP